MTPGNYTAQYIISLNDQQILLQKVIHNITIHEDGTVTESGYDIPSVGEFVACRYDPPRVWDPELVVKYQLIPID